MNNQSIVKQLKALSIVFGLIPSIGFSGLFSEEIVDKTTNVVFIDYSISSATLKDNNPSRLRKQLEDIYNDANEMDDIIIYPIHNHTEIAVPMLHIEKQKLPGNMNDKQLNKTYTKDFLGQVDDILITNLKMDENVRMGTNIYPIVRKLSRYHKDENLKVWIVSDMQHEYTNELLHIDLTEKNVDPVQHARTIVIDNQYQNKLENINVMIEFTETCDYRSQVLRSKLEEFWEEFFNMTGAVVSFNYL